MSRISESLQMRRRLRPLLFYTRDYLNWELGRTPNPPHFVKRRLVQRFRQRYGLTVFCETGTYLGEMVRGVQREFREIHSIELDAKLFRAAQAMFRRDANVHLYQGDSGEVLGRVAARISDPCLFWLDAHFSGGITAKQDTETPIEREIQAIQAHWVPGSVILIDDARCFTGTGDYPAYATIKAVLEKVDRDLEVAVEHDVICAHNPRARRATVNFKKGEASEVTVATEAAQAEALENNYDVLIYSPDAGSAPGHAFVYAANICQEQMDKGKKVLLLTTPGFAAKHQKTYGRVPSYGVLERTNCDCGKCLMPVGFFRKLLYGWYRVTYNWRTNRELKRVLKQGRFPVMHWLENPEIFSTLWFAWSSRRARKDAQTASWFINVHPDDLSWRGHRGDLLRAAYKAASGWGLRRLLRQGEVSRIFVHGNLIKQALCARWGMDSEEKRIVVAPYGSDLPAEGKTLMNREQARKMLGLVTDAYVVLHFGLIRRDKGLDDVIRAVAQVPNVTLLVAGNPTNLNREEIAGWVEEAGITERTHLCLEYIPEGLIEAYFRAADLVVSAHKGSHPGHSGPTHLACTYLIPLAASDCGVVGEFVRENGIGEVFPPGDWKRLVEILQRFLTIDPERYQAYRERELKTREATSWKAMVGTYIQTYSESIGSCLPNPT